MIEKEKKYRVKREHKGVCEAGIIVTPAVDQNTKQIVTGKTGKTAFNLANGCLYFAEDEVEAV